MNLYPSNWDILPDGLYGNQTRFFDSFEHGEQLTFWEKLVKTNALDDEKIKKFLDVLTGVAPFNDPDIG